MKEIGLLLYLVAPTLLAILLLCLRAKRRKVVPLLSVIFNIVLFGVVTRQTSGDSGYMFPVLHIIYPFLCLAVLGIGLIVEIIIRMVARQVCARRNCGGSVSTISRPSFADITLLCIVLISPVILLAPGSTGLLIWCFLIFLSASRLVGTTSRWIIAAFVINGCSVLVSVFLSLANSSSFCNLTGLRLSYKMINMGFTWITWLNIPLNLFFGLALYSLCKKIVLLTSDAIEPASLTDMPER